MSSYSKYCLICIDRVIGLPPKEYSRVYFWHKDGHPKHQAEGNDMTTERPDDKKKANSESPKQGPLSKIELAQKLDQLWGWAKAGKGTDGENYIMSVENVDTFTKDVLALFTTYTNSLLDELHAQLKLELKGFSGNREGNPEYMRAIDEMSNATDKALEALRVRVG